MSTEKNVAGIGTDPDALEAFYREHVEAIQRFVARRVGDPHLVADLVSEIFIAAVESADRYRADRGKPVAWLYGVARNVMADEIRQRSRELRAVGRVSGRRLLDPDSLARIEERIDAASELRGLYGALECLNDDDRALFELVALDGLTIADAAKVLGVKPATARVRLHRGRRLVQSHPRRPDPRPTAFTEEITT
jgi:RNA polymerase sigma factor (sigma-70 family)